MGDIKRAIDAYELAGDWFQGDSAEALANKVFLKVADLAALEQIYPKAIERYEGVAKSSAGNNLMKWSLKDYFLKAGICHLAAGVSPPALGGWGASWLTEMVYRIKSLQSELLKATQRWT